MKKGFAFLSLLVILMLTLTACQAPAEPTPASAAPTTASSEPTDAPAEPLKIALVYGIQGDAFYITMEKGARAKAEELGVEFLADGPSRWDLTCPIFRAGFRVVTN